MHGDIIKSVETVILVKFKGIEPNICSLVIPMDGIVVTPAERI